MVISVFKTTFSKLKPTEIIYGDFKKFSEENFNQKLSLKLTNECVSDYSSFENSFLDTLNHHAPVKKKLLWANHAPYVTKTLWKAITRRSNLQTKYFKTRTPELLEKYRKHIIRTDFKKFSEESFNQKLSLKLTNDCVNNYSSFENSFLDTLSHHAPVKKKLLRANHAPYVTKTLWKAIMTRSNLQTIYFKTRTPKSLKKYRKQKNYCCRVDKKRNTKNSSTT